MNRPRLVWAVASTIIVIIVLVSINFVITNWRIQQINEEKDRLVLEQNRNWCGLFNIVAETARPGEFKDAIIRISESPQYRCSEMVNQPR